MTGSATLVTVLSIKARLEPMMVVARIQGLEVGEQGAIVLPDRMTPSSQGGLPMFATSGLLYMLGLLLYSENLCLESLHSPRQPPQYQADHRYLDEPSLVCTFRS